jgi:MtrB/PioB family decaheme-associated outer membrane protein
MLNGTGIVFAANGQAAVDSDQWASQRQCEYCQLEHGTTTSVEGGLGYVSQDSFKFGEYNGLQEKGWFLKGDLQSRYRNSQNARYWNIEAHDIGLDTGSVKLQGGQQGHYRFSFFYDKLPHYISDSARTPYKGIGGDQLTLPSSWIYAGSTTAMTALQNNLVDADLQTRRARWGVGATYLPTPQWQTSVHYQHQTLEGKRHIAGSFYFHATELVQPVQYTDDTITATAEYNRRDWQTKLAYHGSTFKNQYDSLRWQNPYPALVAGADEGELSLAPDNQFHQVLAAFSLRVNEKSKMFAKVSAGRLTQNENFLAPTVNSTLTPAALPAKSLNGRVDTLNADINWNTRINENFNIRANYRYSNRDNKAPRRTYEWVTTDVNVVGPLTNAPYSYTRDTFKLNSTYKISRAVKTSFGYDYRRYNRTYVEVENSNEQTIWASLVSHATDAVSLTARYAHAQRRKDGYQLIPGVDSPENPLMRKYNMADRNRDTLKMRLDFQLAPQTSMGINLDMANDDYPDSSIGLTSGHEAILGADFSTLLTRNTSANLFISFEDINSRIAGSQLYSTPDWSGTINDQFNTAGMGLNHVLINSKLDIGVDYVYSHSLGEIAYGQSGSGARLPDLYTTLYSVNIYGNYRLNEKLTVKGAYSYENYNSADWAYDNVNEDTIATTLTLGQESPSYSVNVFMISMRYQL